LLFQSSAFERRFHLLPKEPFVFLSPLPSFRWWRRSLSFLLATHGSYPLSPTGIWRHWSKPACSNPDPLAHNLSGSCGMMNRCQIYPWATSLASPRSMNKVSEFRRAALCGACRTTMGWSYTTSTLAPPCRRPSSPPFVRGS
jgi:hypothetical protein